MDSNIQEMVSRFKRLDNTVARRLAYHQILDQLQPHEWRDVRKRINERSFQKDILGMLPLEIAVQITKYLNLEEVHLFRRVSKRWCDVLSSDLACSVMLRQYIGRKAAFTPEDGQDKLAQYAKRRIRLQKGQPAYKLYSNVPFVASSELPTLDYTNGRFCWTTENKSAIVVHSLRSQKTQRFCTENREPFLRIRLSELIVAAITARGYCRAWNLQTEEMYSIRLPSRSASFFTVCGSKIVLSYFGMGFILHYDMQTQVTRTINVAPELAFVGLHPTADCLTLVNLEHRDEVVSLTSNPSSNSSHLRVVKYSLDNSSGGGGDFVQTSSSIIDLPTLRDLIWDKFLIEHDIMDDHRERLGILSAQCHDIDPRNGNIQYIVAITYDSMIDEISLHHLQPEHTPIKPLCMAPIDRNLLYYMKNDNGKPRIWISDPFSDTPHRAARDMDLGLPREAAAGVYTHAQHFSLRGDQDFVFMTDQTGVKVWCFDGDVVTPENRSF